MSVILDRQAEMTLPVLARQLHRIFPGTQRFNYRQREIRKVNWIGGLAPREKISERARIRRDRQFFSKLGGDLDDARPVFRGTYNAAQRWTTFVFQKLGHGDVRGDH